MENPWKTLESREMYRNPWIQVVENQVINPNGGNGIYGVVHFQNFAIGIIPLDEELNTWLVGQYRYPLNSYSWEIPEGGGKKDIPILDSAKRELLEETGLTAKQWDLILTMHLSNSVSDEVGYVFVAKDLQMTTAQPEETEDLQIQKVPFLKAFEMMLSGEITDSLSVASILKLHYLLKLQKQI